ncbi:MAG: tRNA (N(6)-L-threonylcarbamoyladenosine(37)-C(2))-methylthiotran sferase MtaB [Nitrospirales bacterium]|nr:MAG: tRNA (N(6)-L-threonylcarbamoyladenosine(37)-C(2))-methylthiotran sferase MtaB [Nitrospirales bacterium]
MERKSPNTRRVAFYTVGCRLNQAETAILTDQFCRLGFEPVKFGEPTDVLVVNTCSVTEGAETDCRRVVRQVLRTSPHAFVAVTGCYAQTGAETLQSIDGIDLVLGTQYKMQLPDYLAALSSYDKKTRPDLLHTRKIDYESFTIEGTGDYSTTRANLKLQDGCQFMCSFCLIPFARGRERSRLADDAVREAQALAERGHRELVLTGVNLGQYQDAGVDLLTLLQRLEIVSGIDRIRISSIEPTTIPDQLLDYMTTSDKLCRFLHVPLQSGDDTILKAMNRRYTVREYAQFIEEAAQKVPDLCLGTDVMVGFPGEGEQEFANTQTLINDLPFSYLHVFSFSSRPGTAATKLAHPVPRQIIKQRSQDLAKLSQRKRFAFYQRYIGQTVSVLFETQNSSGLWTGLTDHYIKVGVQSSDDLSNEIRSVMISGVTDGLAIGRLGENIPESLDHVPISSLTMTS